MASSASQEYARKKLKFQLKGGEKLEKQLLGEVADLNNQIRSWEEAHNNVAMGLSLVDAEAALKGNRILTRGQELQLKQQNTQAQLLLLQADIAQWRQES